MILADPGLGPVISTKECRWGNLLGCFLRPDSTSRTRTVSVPFPALDSWRHDARGTWPTVFSKTCLGWDHDVRRQDPRDRHHGLLADVPRHLHVGLPHPHD